DVRAGAAAAAGTNYDDALDAGALAQWDVLSSSDSTVALDSTVADSGSTSVRVTDNSADQSSRLDADLAGGGHAQSYTRFCFQIAPGLTQRTEIATGRALQPTSP